MLWEAKWFFAIMVVNHWESPWLPVSWILFLDHLSGSGCSCHAGPLPCLRSLPEETGPALAEELSGKEHQIPDSEQWPFIAALFGGFPFKMNHARFFRSYSWSGFNCERAGPVPSEVETQKERERERERERRREREGENNMRENQRRHLL